MTQPLDLTLSIAPKGDIDTDAGEFWVENPFTMPDKRHNLSAYERNKVYINHQGKKFIDLSFESGADIDSDSRSVVVADFNRDNAPDLLVANVGGGPLRLFENRIGNHANRIRVQLVGVDSNRAGIGSRVIAHCGERQIVRDNFAANGFMGQSPPELILGIGNSDAIDKLEVRWPSGTVQVFENVPANHDITITEGENDLKRSSWAE